MTIILVHGYLGWPENHWFPWLRQELESRGHTVVAPAMPNPAFPSREAWRLTIEKSVLHPDQTIFVGHSLGTVAILAYLSSYSGPPVPHVVLAAGFGRDFLHGNEIVHWFDQPFQFDAIRKKAVRWTCVHSTDDHVVPYAEGEWLAQQLGAHLVTESGIGHLTRRAPQLPSVLSAILDTEPLS